METFSLREKCAIVGVGETEYSWNANRSSLRLQLEASLKAVADAGLTSKDIDGIIPYSGAGVVVEDLTSNLGIPELKFSCMVHQGGASCVAAVEIACMAIVTGAATHVLLTAGRTSHSTWRVTQRDTERPQNSYNQMFERAYGALVPAHYYGQAVRRHIHEYGGPTSLQMGAVAVACRKHANLNPRAQMYLKPMTLDDHQKSPMVSDPFHLFDICLETDGAAAVVVTSAERARDLKQRPAIIMGVAQGHPDFPTSITQRPVITELQGSLRAAKRCFQMAGLTPEDVDVAEIYDCFTAIVILALEDIGFCGKGEGGAFVEGGRIELGGELPINTHGGLLSEGHISGMNHIVEAVRQIRGECDKRQVPNAEIALVEGFGDLFDGSLMLLRR
jgi:acetyl-CoA acetyltransferase